MSIAHTTPIAILVLSVAAAGCSPRADDSAASAESQASAAGADSACTPLETREPNAPDQRPAFQGQTRACGITSNAAFDVVVIAKGLENPWAVEPLPGGDLLVTEKPGRIRIVSAAGQVGQPLTGVPAVDADGQGGLLDIVLSPTFDTDRTVYWAYSEPRRGGNATSVARGVLSADRRTMEQVKVIFRALPVYDGDKHFGSRLLFGPDGMLYVTLGERSDTPMRPQAQQLGSHMGKILRIRPDGSAPDDNPFVGRDGAKPEIWTLGHRNVQAVAFAPDGRLWEIEHGANGGDELNLVEKAKNYGWPVQAYGEEYSGDPIASAATVRDGMEQPVYYWDPVIAPSGMTFYTADAIPGWKGSLLIGSMNPGALVRLEMSNGRVTKEERYLGELGERIRDVKQGPDGFVYLVTDSGMGRVLRVKPAP
jgi:glucose/arabinose dehydrogenase